MIYLDNSATTKVSDKVKKEMLPFFCENYGNPSSLYTFGQKAKEILEEAREITGKCFNASSNEIYFTSGGSESNNWAINSACKRGKMIGKNHIITTAFEHHSVLNTLAEKEKEGFKITYLPVYENGIIKIEDFKKAITADTFFVTIMMANNEIGTLQPIKKIGKICQEKNIIFHTDAVQAAGHIPIDVKEMNIDMLSISAHKFHGPKGVGSLYCRRGCPLFPFIYGGTQENRTRAGTENLASIFGMAKALEESVTEMEEVNMREVLLRNKLFSNLSRISHSIINGDKKQRLSNNVNMCFEGIEGESLLLLLDEKGICVSSGSACTSGSLDPSHVLLAIGRPHEIAHGSLRLTLSKYTTEEEIDYVIKEVPQIVDYLRSISPVWRALEKGEQKYVI